MISRSRLTPETTPPQQQLPPPLPHLPLPLPSHHSPPPLESLVSVAVVFCSFGGECPSGAALLALPHVVSLVSSFLDGATPKRWSIERACEQGLGLRMLKRLAAHEKINDEASDPTSSPSMDPFYRAHLASKGLVAAVRRASATDHLDAGDGDEPDDVEIADWICGEYCPSVVPVHAMGEATRCGRLRVLQRLFERYPRVRPNEYLAELAADAGRLDVVQWILSRLEQPSVDTIGRLLAAAAECGHLGIVRWLVEKHCGRGDSVDGSITGTRAGCLALGNAVANGHFDVARCLVESGFQLDQLQRRRLTQCVRAGDLEMVKWLHTLQFAQHVPNWIDAAAGAGHLHIVQWAHENVPNDLRRVNALDNAARHGHLEIVQWLHANRADGCSTFAMDRAAESGHLDVVQWLHEHRAEGCTSLAMDTAASAGYLDVVQWLHCHRHEGCSTLAMDAAAGAGQLEVVTWLHEHRTEGCSTAAMDGAATNGDLETVQWLHTNRTEGCTTEAIDGAAMNGHLDVVRWLHENRTEGCSRAAMNMAARNGHLDVVKWLHENRSEGCSTNAMDGAESLEMLQWLYDHRSEGCTRIAVEDAAHSGNFEKLLFLREKRVDVFTERAAVGALKGGNFEIFQWLHVKYPEQIDVAAIERSAVDRRDARALFFQFESRHNQR